MRIFRCTALTLALAILPACSSLPFAQLAKQAPISRVQSLEIQAFALVESYSIALEAAARLVANPQTPQALVNALARAEANATPAAASLLRALALFQQAPGAQTGTALAQALAAARDPIRQFSSATQL